MTRPKKQTVDYFPHDCDCSNKKTLYILEQKYGNNGYAFWFKLLEILGSTEGHVIDCSNPMVWQFLQAKTRTNADICEEILLLLVEVGAIDKKLWESKRIWSDNFVERVESVYLNRKSKVPQKPVSSGITTGRNPAHTGITTSRNPQSKVKESKVKESKVKKKGIENDQELIFPGCIDRVLIEKYFQNRIDIKKKMTHHAKELFLLKVEKFHKQGQDVKVLIEKAIIGGWSDIYEEKGNNNGSNNRTSKRKPVEKARTRSESKDIGRKGTPTKITIED